MYYNKRTFAVLAAGLAALGYASADSVIYPASLATQTGSASKSGDNLSALQTKDQSARQDTWDNYVEFYGSDNAYSGVFTFDVSGVDASKVSAYSLNVNYKGSKSDAQKWQFEYYNPSSNTWVAAGDNTDATKAWNWTPLSFCGQESFSNFVADGELKLRFSSDIKYDDCDIDYLSISTVTNGSAPSATESPATESPTTTEAPTTTESPSTTEAPATTVKPTSKPSSASTTRPTDKATQKPATSAPATQKPATSAPATQKPATSAPATQKPATSAPATQKPATSAPSTQKPATSAPSTQKPATSAPVTQKPATSAPVTQKPATSAPVTQKPATSAPATQKPTSASTTAPSTGGRICPTGQVWTPQPGTTWQWQLTGTIDQTKDVQMYDIDLFDATSTLISSLHSKGRAVICYFSTQYEDWRPDASKFTSAILGSNLDDWPGEKYVDIRSTTLRSIMTDRLDLAVSKGCDGVEPDNVDGYTNSNGFSLTAANQLDFNKFIATEAHKRGLSVGLKNDLDQVSQLVSSFDWALNEQCNEYGECDDLKPFITANKAVFGVEYSGSSSSICPKMVTAKMSWLMKDLDLDASGTACCPSSGCVSAPYTCVSYNSKRSDVEENEPASVINNDVITDNNNNNNAEVQTEQHFDSSSSTIFSAAVAVFSFATAVGAMML